jgi:two-component system response regulator HydG
VIIAAGRQIEQDDLPDSIADRTREMNTRSTADRAQAGSEGRSIGIEIELPATMDEVERQVIGATLDYTEGDKSQAARLLDIGRKTLYRKLEQYDGDARG